ncbi:hypothetical protein DdX_21149 [Ditylenchus destructor]|uniref:Uncharacterized protein n=1 Tax=Ditylenchus destructor TaxID=166010 RepID=A0AAD4QVT3_9BILA|nr:hypothetical protein DdX_21149 [Ditylenchus destructor]
MAFNTVTSAAAIPRYTFSLFKISTPVWAGTLSDVHLVLEPLTVFFLALDRCLTVQFMWKAKTERVLFVCNIICNTACILSIVLPAVMANLFNLPLPNAISRIYIFSLKMVAGVLNACACAFLCWKVRAIKKRNISNTIVIVSCVTELLLEFFPNLTAALISIMGYSYIFSYTGPYSKTTQCINVLICAVIYSKTLHAKRRSITKVSVITTIVQPVPGTVLSSTKES